MFQSKKLSGRFFHYGSTGQLYLFCCVQNPGITQDELQKRIESYLTIQYSGPELLAMAQQQQQVCLPKYFGLRLQCLFKREICLFGVIVVLQL